jgi:hypothetical protein
MHEHKEEQGQALAGQGLWMATSRPVYSAASRTPPPKCIRFHNGPGCAARGGQGPGDRFRPGLGSETAPRSTRRRGTTRCDEPRAEPRSGPAHESSRTASPTGREPGDGPMGVRAAHWASVKGRAPRPSRGQGHESDRELEEPLWRSVGCSTGLPVRFAPPSGPGDARGYLAQVTAPLTVERQPRPGLA